MAKKLKNLIMVGIAAVVMLGTTGCEHTNEETVEAVKGISEDWLEDGEEITFEELFDMAFSDSEWSFDEDKDQVVYTGIYSDSDFEFKVKYYLDYEWEEKEDGMYINAQIVGGDLDGDPMDEDTCIEFLFETIEYNLEE